MAGKIRGILFDKDGTLFDFHATWGAWCGNFIATLAGSDAALAQALAKTLDYDLIEGRFLPHSFVVTDSMDSIIEAVHKILPDMEKAALFDFVSRTTCAAPQKSIIDLVPFLQNLRKDGYRLGVATNDNGVPARAHLLQAGVLELFDHVVACDDGFGAKPDPEMLWSFSRAVDLDPGDVVMVGDSAHDLRAGRAAGMRTIGVLSGVVEASDLAPYADRIFPDIGYIPAWLHG